jgi:maltooligosyltrehalose trehalohydrolase
VRAFFYGNALYWLREYRFDGLRLDATHSIVPQDWLEELRGFVADSIDPARHVHLVIEHDGNAAHLLGPAHERFGGYDAQWNDDGHHVLHVLLTGERDGYYVDFANAPADKLAQCLAEGFIYQGQPSIFRSGQPRGEPSRDLPSTAFVLFLQNHDQVGNRAFGERLTTLVDAAALKAASALLLLSPQIPLLFMGEEWGETAPFLYFTSYPDEALAAAVRDGRRGEFASSRAFTDEARRDAIPDPNAQSTFDESHIAFDSLLGGGTDPQRAAWLAHTRALLALRHEHVMRRLDGTRSLGSEAIGPAAVIARWHMGDGAVLTIATNLHEEPVAVPAHRFHVRGELLYASAASERPAADGCLPGHTTWAFLESAT